MVGGGTVSAAPAGVKQPARYTHRVETHDARAAAPRPNLYGLSRAELASRLTAAGSPAYHGEQIFRWLYARRRLTAGSWTDLPVRLRRQLEAETRVEAPEIVSRTESRDGTVKYAVRLPDGGVVETVYMIQRERRTLCVSSQVGCALACEFCLTARMGLKRHLDPGEIVGQIALIQEDRAIGALPFNVVFMGMGEPLHNYDGVLAAYRILTDPAGFGLSRRRIVVSTSGLAPAIERLSAEPEPPRLAVSLNATTDAVRDRLMPVNRRYPIARLLEACRRYVERSGERFTIEYVLLAGINDTDADLARLAKLLRKTPAKLNLIPFNPVPGWLAYRPPERERILAIRDRILAADLPVSIRWSRGADARAACGQLALLPADPSAPQVLRHFRTRPS
jgi:23S rRNA (adenine2503-C2)-methyltransferase